MTSTLTKNSTDTELAALIAEELTPARSLGAQAALRPDLAALLKTNQPRSLARTTLRNALLTDPGAGGTRPARATPQPFRSGLLDVVDVVDLGENGSVAAFTISATSAADVVAEGALIPEATLVWAPVPGAVPVFVGHYMPATTQALRDRREMRRDIDTLLVSGVAAKIDRRIAAAFLAASASMVAQPYATSLAATLRNAIATAQGAFEELGPGPITAILSPADHARLDLAGVDVAAWPARIVSSPAFPAGVAYVGRMKLAAQLFSSPVEVSIGTVDDQLIRNGRCILAGVDVFAHIPAPTAIVAADLTA